MLGLGFFWGLNYQIILIFYLILVVVEIGEYLHSGVDFILPVVPLKVLIIVIEKQ